MAVLCQPANFVCTRPGRRGARPSSAAVVKETASGADSSPWSFDATKVAV